MSRLVGLVVLVTTLCLVHGNKSTVTPQVTASSAHHVAPTKSSSMPHKSITRSSSMPHKSTTAVKPTATPKPNPPAPTNYTYVLMDDANENITCLRMVVDVAVNLTYKVSSNTTRSVWVHFVEDANNESVINYDSSVCFGDVQSPNASLVLKYVSREAVNPYYAIFNFSAIRTPGNQQWLSDGMTVNFTFREADFPSYYGPNKPADNQILMSHTKHSLFDESFQRMELTRPYICRTNQTITGFSNVTKDDSLNVSLYIRQLEVQAFNFTNGGNFTENAARVCLLDHASSGNTVVPIAVGAALAALVIIVLIAYLIGRIRNKKKSSYEPLN